MPWNADLHADLGAETTYGGILYQEIFKEM